MAVYSVFLGLLLIICGISLFTTPITTFLSLGTFVIILFFVSGIFGIIQAIKERRYDKEFFFAILSLILGIIGMVVPGADVVNNFIILYLAAGWLVVRAILSFVNAYGSWKQGDGVGSVLICVLIGVLYLALGIYSALRPDVLAISLGFLVGIYFILKGIEMIVATSAITSPMMVVITILGICSIVFGFFLAATPLSTFWKTGYYLVILFFFFGIFGIVRAVTAKRYKKEFFFAILSLILGILGLLIPGLADMNNYVILYMVAGWLIVRGILVILDAIDIKKRGGETAAMVLGIILGICDLLLGVFSIAYPAILAIALGILVGLFFIESGIQMVLFGSVLSHVATDGVLVVED